MSAITLESITFRYPKSQALALDGVTLEIPRGSFFALLGPNGAGKTTLLRLLCGRFAACAGSVKIAEDLRLNDCGSRYSSSCDVLDMNCCGILLENPGVYPKLSIEEYLSYFAGFYGLGPDACLNGGSARGRVESLAQRLDLPSLTQRMGALSLGNRQKVQILRSLLHNPKLLILDEPVANLDPVSRESVWRLIADWRKQEGGTAIVCSHILAEMENEATDFAIIDKGRVLQAGTVAGLTQTLTSQGVEIFNVRFETPVSAEQVSAALSAAGLPLSSVSMHKTSLADVYRKSVESL